MRPSRLARAPSVLTLALAFATALALTLGVPRAAPPEGSSGGADPAAVWAQAAPAYAWSFPRDHWAHPDYRTEWWYFTGHLRAPDTGARFGFQFTIFRIGLAPDPPDWDSHWSSRALLMGHASLIDKETGEHRFSELLYRAGAGLAGFGEPGDSRLAWSRAPAGTDGLWELHWNGEAFDWSLRDDRLGFAFELSTRPAKPLVFQGPGGFSAKSPEAGAASLYYSFTRLETRGTLTLDGVEFPVRGQSWMDKEFTSRQLGADLVGWDWMSLQLEGDRELMLYVLRDRSGAVAHAQGTWIAADGSARFLSGDAFELRAEGRWRSPTSDIVYPSGWTLQVDGVPGALRIVPDARDQENRSRIGAGPTYWEGSVRVTDASGAALGVGYVELTGYGEGNRPPI